MTSTLSTSRPIQPKLIYPHASDRADEVYTEDGKVREHWRYLLDSLKTLGSDAFEDRNTKARRILRDDGATYNIYSETITPSRAWGLDLVPSLISSEEWAVIEAGLLERAELYNLLLRDIYGERSLIRHGVIPSEALFSHKGFLRPCHGIQLPGEHDLILHACDLMRGTDGEFMILSDRTQSPSGAGYALENRTVMSRVLPSLFRDSHVHRLAPFFQQLRAKLTALSPNQDQPRIVVLTPGPYNETYFEHAYLANYLGLHLVQSGDLVVRNGYLWMKSLDSLTRVDVILRRIDDWFCDPVELKGNSQLGVPGLLEVVRAGRVAIANPLGSGVLESPILHKYMNQISMALLGREPRLSSIETYWCGDEQDRNYVLNNLDNLVVKPVVRGIGMNSIFSEQLDQQQRKQLLQAIQANPMHFVAQPVINAPHLPTYIDGVLQPRPATLRSFAIASDTSYRIMPGGLTRVGIEQDTFMISNQRGAHSKDTWVIASEPERIEGRREGAEAAMQLREAELINLPSRVVENLFWMGRYAERAEASLRILRTAFMMLHGEEYISDVFKRHLLQAVTEVTSTYPGFVNADDELINAPETELLSVVKDPNRAGSVCSNLNAMLYCADESKQLLSTDMLRVINDIRDALSELDNTLSGDLASAPEEALDPLVTALMALAGLTQESMVRSVGWTFMDMGRRLERGIQSSSVIRSLIVPEVSEADQTMLIQTVLSSLEVSISYRRRYGTRMGVQACLDLVMLDNTNPRSLIYQLNQILMHLYSLPHPEESRHELPAEERAAVEAETLVRLSLLTELSSREKGQRIKLLNQLQQLNQLLSSVSTLVSNKYFAHRESSQQLVSSTWENDA